MKIPGRLNLWKSSLLDRQNTGNAAKAVGETVQFFITTMDSLKLNMVAVDQLYPLLNDLMQSLNKVKIPQYDTRYFECCRSGPIHFVGSHPTQVLESRKLTF